MGSARIKSVRQRLALTLTEHVKSKMTDFMKRKPQDRSKQENELFGDMMNENSKSKMMLLTNLESTRDDRVLKPEDRDEEGYITNAWGDTQGTSIKSLDPAESGLDTMNRQQVDYDKQKLLRRSTTNAFSRDEAEKRLNDITEGRAQKSNKPILSTYTQSARIQMARERLGAVGKVDWSKSMGVKPDLAIPDVGAGFLSPKGEYFHNPRYQSHDMWLTNILKSTGDKSLMKKYDPYSRHGVWLKDSGMIRLRNQGQGRGHTNNPVYLESNSTPTNAQIRSLKTYIKDYDINPDDILVDDRANSNLETELKLTNRFNAKLRQRIEAI